MTAGDGWYDQSLHPSTDRTSNRGILHVTDRNSTRGILRPNVRSTVGCNDRSIARSIVASCDRSLPLTTDRTINRVKSWHQTTDRRSIVASCDRSYDQSCDYRSAIIHNWWCHHTQLVVRSRKTYLRPLTFAIAP